MEKIRKYVVIAGLGCIFHDILDYFVGSEIKVVGWLFFMSLLYVAAKGVVRPRIFTYPISKGTIRFEIVLMLNLAYYLIWAIIQDDVPRYIGFGLLLSVVIYDTCRLYRRLRNEFKRAKSR